MAFEQDGATDVPNLLRVRGSDDTYAPITDAVIGNAVLMAGVEFLATPANVEGTAGVCEWWAPGDKGCLESIGRLVEAMRAAKPGTYVPHPALKDVVTQVEPEDKGRKRPTRVAVLTDRGCCWSSRVRG